MTAPSVPVVFIHGLWIHSTAWQPWVELFRSAGYDATAPGWPGDSDSVEQTRKNAAAVAGKGIDDITNGYLDVIAGLQAKPIVIGHSFGGLIAQKLLSGGAAAAAIAIDPGQIKGVKPLPFAQIRSGLPVLSKPGNREAGGSAHAEAVPLRLRQRAQRERIRRAVRQMGDPRTRQAALRGLGRELQEVISRCRRYQKAGPRAAADRRRRQGPHRP